MLPSSFGSTFVIALSYFLAFSLAHSIKSKHAFSVNIERGGKRLTGPAAYRALLLRHGRYVPPELHAAAENPSILVDGYLNRCSPDELAELNKESGSTNTEPIGHDNDFYAEFTVGKSKLNLLIDTGSSDLWVYSDRLPKNETTGHRLYNSSTGTELKGYSWNITYGDMTGAAGIVYRDSVQIGGATATSQAIEAATYISGPKAAGPPPVDGIVGLGFKRLNSVKPNKQEPLWKTLAPSLKEPLFTVDLRGFGTGSLDFGYINSSRHTGPITYVPVGLHGFWYINFTDIKLNGKVYPAKIYKPTLPTAVIDTGYASMNGHAAVANAYFKNVKGAKKVDGSWLFPCRTNLTENIGYKIGGRYFYVYGEYIKQPLGQGICYSAYQGVTGDDGGDLIGDPLILGNFLVFDGVNKRMGWAHKDLDLDN